MGGKKVADQSTPPGCGSVLPTPPKKVVVKKVVDTPKSEVKKVVQQGVKTCPPGKVLNPKTNRCVQQNDAKPCPEGKTRNPVTNRCIKISKK